MVTVLPETEVTVTAQVQHESDRDVDANTDILLFAGDSQNKVLDIASELPVRSGRRGDGNSDQDGIFLQESMV